MTRTLCNCTDIWYNYSKRLCACAAFTTNDYWFRHSSTGTDGRVLASMQMQHAPLQQISRKQTKLSSCTCYNVQDDTAVLSRNTNTLALKAVRLELLTSTSHTICQNVTGCLHAASNSNSQSQRNQTKIPIVLQCAISSVST